jgi:hypothetical protein
MMSTAVSLFVIQVIATQHNLPSNSKRQLQFTAFVPEPHRHHQVLCSGLPTELQQSVLNSLSPSGERMRPVRAVCAALHTPPRAEQRYHQVRGRPVWAFHAALHADAPPGGVQQAACGLHTGTLLHSVAGTDARLCEQHCMRHQVLCSGLLPSCSRACSAHYPCQVGFVISQCRLCWCAAVEYCSQRESYSVQRAACVLCWLLCWHKQETCIWPAVALCSTHSNAVRLSTRHATGCT